jgi:hypothetical protein
MLCTNAVVAKLVLLLVLSGVGAVGVPVNVGEASGANDVATNAVVAIAVLLVPAVGVGDVGTPVNAGDAKEAPPTPVTSESWRVTAPVLVLNEVTAVVVLPDPADRIPAPENEPMFINWPCGATCVAPTPLVSVTVPPVAAL